MANYIDNFLKQNQSKPFVTNLLKYSQFESNISRAKVISSFLTHLLIDKEHGIDNSETINEVLSLLIDIILYDKDQFMPWLRGKTQNN